MTKDGETTVQDPSQGQPNDLETLYWSIGFIEREISKEREKNLERETYKERVEREGGERKERGFFFLFFKFSCLLLCSCQDKNQGLDTIYPRRA